MALTFRITKAKFDKLADDVKEHYEPDGDKHYKLDVDGIDDAAEALRARDREKERATELDAELKAANKKIKTLEDATGDGGADVARLQKSHDRKVTTLTEEHATKLKGRDDFITSQLVDNQALTLATEISTVPSLMADNIRKRLTVDFSGDKPALVILDKDGKPAPAMEIEALKAELLANPEFKPILVGSKATGSGAPKGNSPASGGAPAQSQQAGNQGNQAVDVNALDGKGLVERIKAKQAASGQQAA